MFTKKLTLNLGFAVLLLSATTGAEKNTPAQLEPAAVKWIPVNTDDWQVYMDAPSYHFSLAKKYFTRGDTASASAELKRGKTFLEYQKKRIAASLDDVDRLLRSLKSGRLHDTLQFDSVTSHTLTIIGEKFTMVPAEVEGRALAGDDYDYHLTRAKEAIRAENRTATAEEIRQASVFLRLKAAGLGITPWSKVDSASLALERLSARVKSGEVKKEKELNEVFRKATSLFRSKK
jgi:hypothetical protein